MRPSSLIAAAVCLLLAACASAPAGTAGAGRPSISETRTIEFIGKTFEFQFQDTAGPTRIYEYFTGDESPEDWLELVEFQVYPVHPEANEPIDFAKRTAAALQQRYPTMQFALYTDDDNGSALLDFFFPTSQRKEPGKQFLEFNAFKFFRDEGSPRTLSFHYARNIEALSSSRTEDDVIEDLKKTRAAVVPAMAQFPLYRQ